MSCDVASGMPSLIEHDMIAFAESRMACAPPGLNNYRENNICAAVQCVAACDAVGLRSAYKGERWPPEHRVCTGRLQTASLGSMGIRTRCLRVCRRCAIV